MTTATIEHPASHIAGNRPAPRRSCSPDGSHRWATRTFTDGAYTFTEYNGWLVSEQHTSTSPTVATAIEADIAARLGRPTEDQA